jgi:succinate-semialdehyde dehydrogenase / glutarate-semialdehyde dehydrogenase
MTTEANGPASAPGVKPALDDYHKKAIANLKDPSLFISDAFIDGQWVRKEKTFDVYGLYYPPHF